MEFRDWPSWLKGGLIFVIIGLGLFFIMDYLIISEYTIDLIVQNLKIGDSVECAKYGTCYYLPFSIRFIFDMLIYFLIGALIGLIIGKLKSKKQPQNLNQKGVNTKNDKK